MFSILSHWVVTVGTTETLLCSVEQWVQALVFVTPDSLNAGIVYVWKIGLTAWAASPNATDWQPLTAASNPAIIPIGNPNSIYVRASQASQKAYYMVVKID